MSAIFGEILSFRQGGYPEIQLRVTGDEFYALHETLDGFTVVYDRDAGGFCYALNLHGALASSGVSAALPPPPGTPRHLRESAPQRARRFEAARSRLQPRRASSNREAALTFGPSQGLLEGRRLSIGRVRGLTLLVEFKDVRTTVTVQDIEQLLNGNNYTANGNFCSAREYFLRVSSNKLEYTNDVRGPFRLSQNQAYYVDHLLVEEALNLAVAAGVDLTRYDSRGEGILDALNIMYAGQTQYLGEIWPHNSTIDLRYGSISTNLYLLTSAGRSAADLSIGTFCHENGHLLCRFPDMYDYGAITREGDGVKSAGIGSYCLMGSGNHLNFGRTPSPVCAYLRDLAGWCDKEVILNSKTNVSIAHGAYDTVFKYQCATPNEYFIVENRSKLALDTHLPASGLAVYHCDILGSNEFQQGSAQKHYQCALLQADARTDLEHNVNQGDGTDLFGAVAGVALSHSTSPSTRLWNGSDSGLVLGAIGVPGEQLELRVGAASGGLSVHAENATALDILDNDPTGISSHILVDRTGLIRRLVVKVEVVHSYIGDLVVQLIGPSGLAATLHSRTGAGTHDLSASYDSDAVPALAAFVGRPVQGDWQLVVRDLAGQDVGRLSRWSLDAVVEGPPARVSAQVRPALAIPDNAPAGVSSTLTLDHAGLVGALQVGIDISHTYIGDLRIELVSPTGRSAVLHAQLGAGEDNLVVSYDSSAPLSPLSGLVGQAILGNWTLRVADLAPVDTGTLDRWSLEVTPA